MLWCSARRSAGAFVFLLWSSVYYRSYLHAQPLLSEVVRGGIVGPQDLLLKVWEILKSDGPALGLQLNPSKCEWSWLNAECTLPCPLAQVALVPTSQIQMLGVPLGSDEFVASHVEGKLLATAMKVMAKLAVFEDAQAAMYLLRLSYGIVRANHFMRTTPLRQWSKVARKFDACVRDTVSQILGTTFPGDAYLQACISTKIGGLGVRLVEQHADGAFNASWHEAGSTCGEKWLPPDAGAPVYQSQTDASAAVDRAALDGLIARGSSETLNAFVGWMSITPTRGSQPCPLVQMGRDV